MSLFVIEQNKPKPPVLSTQTPMQTPRFRPHLLALAVTLSLGSVCLPAQAMTNAQALALEKSAWLHKDAAALAQLQTAAQSGDANAQQWLGYMYEYGQGVPLDYAQALFWSRKAAAQGNADAQINLGNMYYYGQGVPQDYAQAVYWYRKAAEPGNALAQFSLGYMYAKGHGVPQDYVIAYALYNLSASGDPSSDNPAPNCRSKLAARMTPKQIAAGQELTRRMMKMGVTKAIDSWR